ncbi:hypothetical protein D3C77_561800 [compost metagenome]
MGAVLQPVKQCAFDQRLQQKAQNVIRLQMLRTIDVEHELVAVADTLDMDVAA